jgi:hypothetical protein
MIEALVNIVIYLIVLGLVFWLLDYVIRILPIPDPFRSVARTVLIVLMCLVLIVFLLQFVQGGGYRFMRIT